MNRKIKGSYMDSRIPGFYKLSVTERLDALLERNIISEEERRALKKSKIVLKPEEADKMVENVIGVFGLPMGLGLNFLINGIDYIVPMVVEEPSIIAAVSSSAKIIRKAGGFQCKATDPVLIGQVQVVNMRNISKAGHAVVSAKQEILNLANSLHPKMAARGGGARDLEIAVHSGRGGRSDMLIVNILVDTRDAMGANLVNSMCEGIAPLIEKITGGEVFLRILSNLADRSMVKAVCEIPAGLLTLKETPGEEVRDAIILANDFACVDPYRAATHNKGIMNGIDPVAIATGNDWRAVEASAHAWAGRGDHYTSLTQWYKGDDGSLTGVLNIPLKVGTVGGSLESNPAIKVAHKILGVSSATELGMVMAAVGLAQNFGALKALATEGIQRGHMSLHARSVAMTAGTSGDIFEEVVERLIESGEIKIWKAREIIKEVKEKKVSGKIEEAETRLPSGHGKVILFGEHAVVYGSHAVAAPITMAIETKIRESENGVHLLVPKWGIEKTLKKSEIHQYNLYNSLEAVLNELGLSERNFIIEVFPRLPKAAGLGGSAALAVSIIRALSGYFNLNLSDDEVNRFAYLSEEMVHGNPSGIDNTLAVYGEFILYKKGEPPLMKKINVKEPIPIVIGLTGVESLTASMVSRVREGRERNLDLYDKIFEEIDMIALEGVKALEAGNLERLGGLMNVNQGLLNALQVSSWEIEELVETARKAGALGAKLTGGGGGGAVVCLTPGKSAEVAAALKEAGYDSIITTIG